MWKSKKVSSKTPGRSRCASGTSDASVAWAPNRRLTIRTRRPKSSHRLASRIGIWTNRAWLSSFAVRPGQGTRGRRAGGSTDARQSKNRGREWEGTRRLGGSARYRETTGDGNGPFERELGGERERDREDATLRDRCCCISPRRMWIWVIGGDANAVTRNRGV